MFTRPISILVVAFAGCAAPMTSIHGQSVYEQRWNEDEAELSRRAQFDLSCEHSPKLTLLKESEGVATAVGVEACGKKATYIRQIDELRNTSTWMMNAEQSRSGETSK